jgi:hypothetical protein
MVRGRSFVQTLVAVAVLVLAAGPASPAPDTTGTVSIESMSVAAGVGYAWGNGVLEYRGQRYPFTVRGFSVVDVGVSKVFAQGEVYNLEAAEDFEGMFMAAVASATLGGGAGAAAMRNQHDVRIVWTASNQGLSFSLAQAGFNVSFTEQARQALRDQKSAEQPAAAPRAPR